MQLRYIYCLFILCWGAAGPHAQTRPEGSQMQAGPKEKPKPKTKTANEQQAEPGDDPVYRDTIIVTEPQTGRSSGNTYQRIPLHQGENKTATKLSEIIEKQHGVRVNRLGAPGTYSTLSIRGANPDQTGVYIDGIAINDPLGGPVNLESLPLQLFQSAQLYRSYTPAYIRGTHIGGALDLMPRPLKANERLWFVDSYANTLRGGAVGLGLRLPWTLQFVKLEENKNRYDYYDDNGTPLFNTTDDQFRQRENEDYQELGYTGLFGFESKKHTFKLLLDMITKERGLPGIIGAPLFQVRLRERRSIAKAAHQTAVGENILLDSSVAVHSSRSLVRDPNNELSFGIKEQERSALRIELGLGPSLYFLEDKLIIESSGHLAQTRLTLDQRPLAKRSEQDLGLALSYLQPRLGQILVQEKFLFVQDHPEEGLESAFFFIQDPEPEKYMLRSRAVRLGIFPLDILQLGKAGGPGKRTGIEAYAMLANSERHPSLTEAYGNGHLVLGNQNLVKERSTTYSYGLNGELPMRKGRLSFDLSYFQTHSTDLIIFIQTSLRTIRAENIGAAVLQGLEAETKWEWQPYIVSNLRFTHLDAKDDGERPFFKGKLLPFRPRYAAEWYLESGTHQLRPFINLHWLGSLYRDRQNSERKFVPGRTRFDAGLSYYFNKYQESRLSFVVKNLLDDFHSDVFGFPLPDRTYEIQFYKEINFNKRRLK